MFKLDGLESAYNEDAIENGAWMQFNGPDGEPFFITVNGQKYAAMAKVRSHLSLAYERHMDQIMEGTANKARRVKSEHQRGVMIRKQMKENEPQAFAALVSALKGVSLSEPGEISPPPSDLLHFALQPKNKDWVEQVVKWSQDNANYGGEEATAVLEGKGDALDTSAREGSSVAS